MNRPQRFDNATFKPRRYHGYAAVLFIFGTLFPPLAVAARFGIGKDFYLNLVLTICGYIPGHVHNFYIQNIRSNKNNRRTPKWASRYGLVDTTEIERKKRKSQWATRYSERLPNSTLEGRDVEEGQVPETSSESLNEATPSQGELWSQEEESYYGRQGTDGSTRGSESAGRWHYPANFEDTEALPVSGGKKKKKKDRWARTEDARLGVDTDDGNKRKKKKKKSSKRVEEASNDFINPNRGSLDSSTVEGPEDPEGRQHDPSRHHPAVNGSGTASGQRDEFEHEF
ncbi:hypothetical protein K439DRAFT_1635104 [Ramaria rubella]|nr:hypothetical protein K439DRAFT_1635104 [Ramaria rubella]